MFKFWPWRKKTFMEREATRMRDMVSESWARLESSATESFKAGQRAAREKYGHNAIRYGHTPYGETPTKPKDNEMTKSEAKIKARKCFDTYEDRAASMVHDADAGEYRVTYKGATGQRAGFTFEYTPEPPPIKEGVLCVGQQSGGKTSVGFSTGGAMSGFPMKNARPVTPADLLKWGLESTWSCSNCKNEGNSTICGKCEYITWRGRFEEIG